MKEKYPVLIGHSTRACKKLFTMEQVADFICEQGMYGEVTIETPEGLMLISTFLCCRRSTACQSMRVNCPVKSAF